MSVTVETGGTIQVNPSGTVSITTGEDIRVTGLAPGSSVTNNISTVAQRVTGGAITGGVTATVAPDTNFDTDMIGAFVVVDAFSSDAEIATVTGASVITSVAATFANSHSSGVPVVILQDDYIPVRLFGGATAAALNAACTAATAAGIPMVLLPADTIDVGNGFSMSGYSCGLVGQGTEVSVLEATTQSGPVLNLSGWTGSPFIFVGNVEFGGFKLVGSGSADATKANHGLSLPGTGVFTNLRFRDIAVSDTGGPGVFLDTNTFFCTFDKLTIRRPVGADTNDVPYVHLKGVVNGNRFNELFLRSNTTSPDGSKVVFLEYDSALDNPQGPQNNTFEQCYTEFQHIPNNGAFFYIDGKLNTISNLQPFDTVASTSSPSNNSWVYFGANAQGNSVYGYIPGRNTNADSIQYGVIDAGGGNMAIGTKGFRGYNYHITYTGTAYRSACVLIGAEAAATDPAITYGASVNRQCHYIHDGYNVKSYYGLISVSQNQADGRDLVFQHEDSSTVRFRLFSSSGPYLHALSATAMEVGADNLIFTDGSGNYRLQITTGDILDFRMTMGNSTKSPTTDAPTDWVQVKIGGTDYYLPAYTAS